MSDPTALGLKEAAAAIRRKKLSSLELTRALLDRIEAWQPVLNAFVRVEPEHAIRAAKAADRALAAGRGKGPLHGIPLAHKDMYYTEGEPVGCGSRQREGFVAPATSTVIARLQAAGAIRLGALNMAEFAYGPTGHNDYLGHARNPWHPDHITGGSSSGSGAAVAARLTAAALGSDTGGSIRLPAHFCGICGFKPTNGRVSRANALQLSFTLDTVGPLARSAQDCALVMATIAGEDPLDPTTFGAPRWNAKAAARPVKGMTIGVPASYYVDDLEGDVAAALDGAIDAFRRLGARIVKVELPDQVMVSAAALIVIACEATSLHAQWLRTRPDRYTAQVRNRLQNGLAYSAVEYLEALRWRGPALAAHLAAIGKADAVIAPASRAAAPTIADTDVGGGPGAETAIQAMTRFLRPVNYLGLPTLVIPAGQGSSGLPIGLQLIGRPFGDESLIALGTAFQQATDFHTRAPTLPG